MRRSLAEMEALSFVLSLSFFPPKESYSVVQDAEERREKGVTMNSILNSLFTSFDWFFFLTCLKKQLFWHIKARENTEREQKREKENSKKQHTTQTRKRKKISHTFLVEKKMPQITPTISLKTSESTYFLGKFSLTTNDALLERRLIKREYEEGKIMSASCARCGYTIYLREASELISCQSCNLTHATETLFNDADDDDENEDALVTTGGGKKMMKTISNAASFLYKFNIEPKNPDGTKIGSERDDENVSRERRATVDEPCPKCDNHVLRFYTMQLRSADEGQTVFYECEKCKHTFSQNN